MDRLKQSFENNRSRVAVAGGGVVDVAVVIVCEALGVPKELTAILVAALTARVTAYIVGNGRYEAQQLVTDKIPNAPKK